MQNLFQSVVLPFSNAALKTSHPQPTQIPNASKLSIYTNFYPIQSQSLHIQITPFQVLFFFASFHKHFLIVSCSHFPQLCTMDLSALPNNSLCLLWPWHQRFISYPFISTIHSHFESLSPLSKQEVCQSSIPEDNTYTWIKDHIYKLQVCSQVNQAKMEKKVNNIQKMARNVDNTCHPCLAGSHLVDAW